MKQNQSKNKKSSKPPIATYLTPAPVIFRAPLPPKYRLTEFLTIGFLILSVTISLIANYTLFWRESCSEEEQMVQVECEPGLRRLRMLAENTVPDFSKSPIAIGVERQCEKVENCLSSIQCTRLKTANSIPSQCRIFQFFNTHFETCRTKIWDSMRDLKYQRTDFSCAIRFFNNTGPILCRELNAGLFCVQNLILAFCQDDEGEVKILEEFNRSVEEYREVIKCEEERVHVMEEDTVAM